VGLLLVYRDKKWLGKLWPAVLENINNAAGMRDERGLFTSSYWNMFDWASIDQKHKTVLHNSLFLVGAVQAAIKCAKVLVIAGKKQILSGCAVNYVHR